MWDADLGDQILESALLVAGKVVGMEATQAKRLIRHAAPPRHCTSEGDWTSRSIPSARPRPEQPHHTGAAPAPGCDTRARPRSAHEPLRSAERAAAEHLDDVQAKRVHQARNTPIPDRRASGRT